ncbi:AAA family ATPase, partial [Pseudomonas syringae pv. syringae]
MSGRQGRFVPMNCAAIPESLAESELFGVVSGAYTGADRSRMGYIEAAQGGTLYLDEIDSMPLALQAKLLRVLETRALERLGSTSTINLDICVIASAQACLDDAVEEGKFRRDLYRILPLFTRFVAASAKELSVPIPDVCPLLQQVLTGHHWPGNIRELKAAAKRHVLGFPLLGADSQTEEHLACGLKFQLRAIEKALIQQALKRHRNCIDAASLELDIPRRTLYRRIKELSI